MQKLQIEISTEAETEEEFKRICDAVLLRLLSASMENRPVDVHGFPQDVHVTVARPPFPF